MTNIGKHVGIYQAKVTAPAGFTATVSPEWMIIPKGKSATYKVTLTRTNAAFGQFSFGSITLDEFLTGRHLVTSPIAARPVPLAALAEGLGTGTTGTAALSPTPGYTGTLTASVSGLAASAVTDLAFTATNTNFNTAAPAESDSVKKVTVTVPAGSALARFATYDDQAPMGTDSDMFVYRTRNQPAGRPERRWHQRRNRHHHDRGHLRHLRRDVRAHHADAADRHVPRLRGTWHGCRQPDRHSGQPSGDDGYSRHNHAELVRPDGRVTLPRCGDLRRWHVHLGADHLWGQRINNSCYITMWRVADRSPSTSFHLANVSVHLGQTTSD